MNMQQKYFSKAFDYILQHRLLHYEEDGSLNLESIKPIVDGGTEGMLKDRKI